MTSWLPSCSTCPVTLRGCLWRRSPSLSWRQYHTHCAGCVRVFTLITILYRLKTLNSYILMFLMTLPLYNVLICVSEQSITEKQVMAETLAKVELAQKQLAFCYSSLVLGLGLSQQHHMACGRSRVSLTYKDRQLYECLYSFFCYVAWVTFSRKELRGIQEEVGRLLRSDTFNPALRTRIDATEDTLAQDSSTKEGQTEPKVHTQSHNAPEQRKSQRRPALSKIVTQRSPVMVSLLPYPREEAPHLFRRYKPRKQSQAKLYNPETLMEELKEQLASVSFGILGKPLSQFSCTTLMPQGANNEDEEEEDDEDDDDEDSGVHVRSSKNTFMAQRPVASAVDQRGSHSRANTVISRATTEGVSSDTE
uniref:Protein phosphatase 1 regulatory subunit 36 n=1 Tax=Salmo trutta TaxID=8032 RepID=A0A674DDE9_SALTR